MSNTKKVPLIAEKIKQARKQAGLSQKALGKVLRLSDKAVSSYEVGRAVPPIDTLREISRVTYKPVSYFMSDDHSEEEDIHHKILLIEKELSEIKELLKQKQDL